MKSLFLFLGMGCAAVGCGAAVVTSPDGGIEVNVDVDGSGKPVYSVSYKGMPVVAESGCCNFR